MKITFIGTGNMGSLTRCNTSIAIDNILFDVGMGTVKQYERLNLQSKDFKYVIISHFHADHFFDIPNLFFGKMIRKEVENKMTFIGPRGLKRKVQDLLYMHSSDGNTSKYDNIEEKYNIEFVELGNREEYSSADFKLKAYELNHGNCKPVNGYILEKENKKIAYICDTTICDNLYEMCSNATNVICDVNYGEESNKVHLGLNDMKNIAQKHIETKFYAVHRGDYEVEKEGINILFPDDGDIIYV